MEQATGLGGSPPWATLFRGPIRAGSQSPRSRDIGAVLHVGSVPEGLRAARRAVEIGRASRIRELPSARHATARTPKVVSMSHARQMVQDTTLVLTTPTMPVPTTMIGPADDGTTEVLHIPSRSLQPPHSGGSPVTPEEHPRASQPRLVSPVLAEPLRESTPSFNTAAPVSKPSKTLDRRLPGSTRSASF